MEFFSRRIRRLVGICPIVNQNLVNALDVVFCIFINTTAYHWADGSLHLQLAFALPGSTDNINSLTYGHLGYIKVFLTKIYLYA